MWWEPSYPEYFRYPSARRSKQITAEQEFPEVAPKFV
jgi:hypothetical protein